MTMTSKNQYTAVMWSWTRGKWHRIDGARPAREVKKDTRGTIVAAPAVTNDDLLKRLEERIAFAEKHGHTVHYKVTMDGRCPLPPRG